ncbi:HAD hydrolase-like protein [Nocardia puris]|uniref:HAD hydrolase-like protein n=1 Tax=Nocardia puris TaxID=208602 RepID=UPI00350E59CF
MNAATAALNVSATRCVFVGDSATDIEASRLAGIPVNVFANKLEKVSRFIALTPATLVTSIF